MTFTSLFRRTEFSKIRIPIAIFLAAIVMFPPLLLLPSHSSNSWDRPRSKSEAEYACANHSTKPSPDHVSELELKLAQCVEMYANAPFTFYPLYIPNFREFVQRLIRGEPVDKTPIVDALAAMSFSPAPLYFKNQQPLGLLIIVRTAAGNVENRDAYRSTWANPEYLEGIDIPVAYAFLMGTGQFGGKIPPELVAESNDFRDIIFQDFVDSYANLTYKAIGGLQWAVKEGPQFEFLATIDDDIYFSVEQAIQLLKFPEDFYEPSNKSDNGVQAKYGLSLSSAEVFLAGSIMEGTGPVRKKDEGLSLSWDEYPLDSFAPYCSGMTTFYSAATAREIYEASLFVKTFPIEDAFIGLVAKKLGIAVTNIWPAVFPSYDLEEERDEGPLIARHIPDNVTLRLSFWHQMHSES